LREARRREAASDLALVLLRALALLTLAIGKVKWKVLP
jgi:hypothetical protein